MVGSQPRIGIIIRSCLLAGNLASDLNRNCDQLAGHFRSPSIYSKPTVITSGKKGVLPDLSNNLLVPLLALIFISSFFLRNLQVLSAWTGALPEFFTNLIQFDGFQVLGPLINLVVSNPFILIFGISGFVSSWRKADQLGKVTSIWFLISLLILLIIPGRQAVDLIWLVFPLWVATARELFRIYQLAKDFWVVYAIAGLVGVLIVLNWLTFTGMVFQGGNSKAVLLQWGLIVASLALVVLSMTIAASEWGWSVSLKGLGLGSALLLTIYMLSAYGPGMLSSSG